MELLAPAGNFERLKVAFNYGADACYLAGKRFGLRAFSDNFDEDELKECVEYAHKLNKKIYVTLNILAHNSDFVGMKEYVEYLDKLHVDAVIVSDIGIMKLVKDTAPNLPIHVSTQANITNKYSAKVFCDHGATRLILAREMSLTEIREIRDFIPKNVEIEAFCHGAMCISYSGRCLLSNYMTGRDSNRGACVQACRFCYTIKEYGKDGEEYPICEDEKGTYILNSKDMCMIKYLDKIRDAGVASIKIEGRMKSPYYVATIVNAYRRALDILEDNKEYVCPQVLIDECEKTSHRRYSTGFYMNADDKEYLLSSMPVQTYEFMAIVVQDSVGDYAKIEMRNRFKVGDTLQILSPSDSFNKDFVVTEMYDENSAIVNDAMKVQQVLSIKCPYPLHAQDILRKKIVD